MSNEAHDESRIGSPVPNSDAAHEVSASAGAPDGGPYNPLPDDELDGGALAGLREKVLSTRYEHAALARQVRQEIVPELASVREATSAAITELRQDRITALSESLRPVNDAVERHEVLLQRIVARQERDTNPPVDWAVLTLQQAGTQWARLADWIEQLWVPWHDITREQLPDCWALHRPVVVELSALRSAHVQAYLPHTDPAVALDWLHRWLPTGLTTIRAAVPAKWCRPGEHMISVEESNTRRRATAAAREPAIAPAPTRPSPGTGDQLGRMQLASREFWQGFYDQARDADLDWRSGHERRSSAATPADKWA